MATTINLHLHAFLLLAMIVSQFHSVTNTARFTKMGYYHETVNPSAWGLLKPSSYCDEGRFFFRVFKF